MQERLLERFDDPAQEADAVGAVDDAVIVGERQRQHEAAARTDRSPCCRPVRYVPREMPRIATSGALTIGVNDVPPMPPRFEMLKQPPCISSSEILRDARLLGQLRQLRRRSGCMFFCVRVPDDRHQQAAIGVDGDADVDVLLDDHLVVRQVDRRVELRKHLERRRDDLHGDRGDRQAAAGGLGLLR